MKSKTVDCNAAYFAVVFIVNHYVIPLPTDIAVAGKCYHEFYLAGCHERTFEREVTLRSYGYSGFFIFIISIPLDLRDFLAESLGFPLLPHYGHLRLAITDE